MFLVLQEATVVEILVSLIRAGCTALAANTMCAIVQNATSAYLSTLHKTASLENLVIASTWSF
jgi:hypothetical protein